MSTLPVSKNRSSKLSPPPKLKRVLAKGPVAKESTPTQKAKEFLSIAREFQLGKLHTETPHPLTRQLSQLVKKSPIQAVNLLKQIDIQAMETLLHKAPSLVTLHQSIHNTLQNKGKIFISGCGATGRLAISLEMIWRTQFFNQKISWVSLNSVVGFMAGGDAALIRSIENFEDHPEYGAKQLRDLGFGKKDLLIACTEGGETPYVIGTVWEALKLGKQSPYFIYGNPDQILKKVATRSREVLENPSIHKVNLDAGPMVIAGSTRMQSSTLIMMAVGLCLKYFDQPFSKIVEEINSLKQLYTKLSLAPLGKTIRKESQYIKSGHRVLYQPSNEFAITVLTDTTERSPTFNLTPFENIHDPQIRFSSAYLYLPHTSNAKEAWQQCLNRKPRTLTWPEGGKKTNTKRLMGYDFSAQLKNRRLTPNNRNEHHSFFVKRERGSIHIQFEDVRWDIPTGNDCLLRQQLLLKSILNIHSTLVMGLLDRYKGNLMTWVHPTNNKLIDRTIRIIRILAGQKGIKVSYQKITLLVFQELCEDKPEQSIVERVLSRL